MCSYHSNNPVANFQECDDVFRDSGPTFGRLGPTYDRLKGPQLFQVTRSANLSQTALGT